MMTGEGKTLVATLPRISTPSPATASTSSPSPTTSPAATASGCRRSTRPSASRPGSSSRTWIPNSGADRTTATSRTAPNSEFGFDYLRDNMKLARWGDDNYPPFFQQVQRNLNYAIIDEVDNILVDEARTPLIISGPAKDDPDLYRQANKIAVQLSDMERKAQVKLKEIGHGLNIPDHPLNREEAETDEHIKDESATKAIKAPETETASDEVEAPRSTVSRIELPPEEKKEKRLGYYFEVKEKERTCHLTDEGVRMAEKLAGVDSFYTSSNMEWPHLIDNALKAHHLYQKDKNYVVMRHPETNDMAVVIVDEFTGRLMVGRQWSDGLHQAVEAKHEKDGVKIKEETQTLATVTLQNYFKLYKKLSGMTGTAMTEANEFWKIYKLEVIAIPDQQGDGPAQLSGPRLHVREGKVGRDRPTNRHHPQERHDPPQGVRHRSDHRRHRDRDSEEIKIALRNSNEKKTVKVADIDSIDRIARPILIGTTDVARSEKLSRLLRSAASSMNCSTPSPNTPRARRRSSPRRAGAAPSRSRRTWPAAAPTSSSAATPRRWRGPSSRTRIRPASTCPPTSGRRRSTRSASAENMEEEGREVADMGGLHVLGTERHEARRIDNQLRGRAGRQGDPGSSRFYVSLQDDLMRVFAASGSRGCCSGSAWKRGRRSRAAW